LCDKPARVTALPPQLEAELPGTDPGVARQESDPAGMEFRFRQDAPQPDRPKQQPDKVPGVRFGGLGICPPLGHVDLGEEEDEDGWEVS